MFCKQIYFAIFKPFPQTYIPVTIRLSTAGPRSSCTIVYTQIVARGGQHIHQPGGPVEQVYHTWAYDTGENKKEKLHPSMVLVPGGVEYEESQNGDA